ncbi:protein MpFLV1 [Marchantia polymorpha subsp. ruderalis]|uniref:Flavodoxin-like domain-containing protein n=2 Tax=Marchantia polymorpha TaxID=3197 RepID=A0AAF6ALA1_MARPO|nr:flavodiiron protein A [Marchantia polymorpha]PTQ48587.1 hypothetical protein MARPO_0005s0210 [Marchantia polymorpha]BBM97221.1 hypothetical protein Mp_1g03970 [Marchantia polymorpha subsp. ruderalis]|eukprot:PTQ48587.1 hypothetical protein MARPO_0005s0210 [Marchantia polymorpha]
MMALTMPIAQCAHACALASAAATSGTSSAVVSRSGGSVILNAVGILSSQHKLRSSSWTGLRPGAGVSQLSKTDGIHVCREVLETHGLVRAAAVDQSSVTTGAPPPPPAAPIKQESDVRISQVAKDTMTIRGRCMDRLKYEVEYGLKRGTTNNSYVIKGTNSTALIDIMDQSFAEAFTKTLETAFDLSSIKYLVLGHFSPKRVESLKILLQALEKKGTSIEIYCSNPAAQLLTKLLASDTLEKVYKLKTVRAGDVLDLGGHELQFILTPTPRWPDGMCSYDPSTQLLFSQKLFSAHVCEENDYDIGGVDVYGEDWRFYFECMLASSPKQTKAALEKLDIVAQYSKPSYKDRKGVDVVKEDMKFIFSTVLSAFNLPISKGMLAGSLGDKLVTAAICPLHGPIVRSSLTELVREYGVWTYEKLKQSEEATVAVIYASAYGNTTALAQAISRGISKAGVGVDTLNVEICSTEELVASLQRCSGFVIGSPTLGGHMPTPIQNALGVILCDEYAKKLPCGVFGSFGWSGEAVDMIEQRLKDCDFNLAFPTIRCKFKPTEATLQVCEESGTDLAQAIRKLKLKKRSEAAPKFTVASNVEQAVGRVVGSLCVLTARSGDAESAMLASWVSQASFVPPGLTIAVAKDRAVEGLVLVGARFVVNVLGQNKSNAVAKQLLKPFLPGENRMEGLETTVASNGGLILKDAISWMECTVQSRMETGDHWVLYAVVDSGKLEDDTTLTAVHYRKTGARY